MVGPLDAAVALGLGLASAPVVLWGLRSIHLLDLPNARSSHDCPTPRAGGLAPALAATVAAFLSRNLPAPTRAVVLFVAVCMGLIGLADDIHGMAPLPRLLGQVAVSAVALFWIAPKLTGQPFWQLVTAAGIVVGLVGYVNAFNFMDGINGISVAQVLVAGIAWWAVGTIRHVPAIAALGLIEAAALVAFAPFNFPRAAMFLGDIGSYFFGAWLAVTAVVGLRAGIPPEAVLAPLALYSFDTLVTLARRVLRGEECLRPHREHVYQQLVDAGWSQTRTAISVGLLLSLTSGLGALSLTGLPLRVIGDILLCVLLIGYLRLPLIVARSSPRPEKS